jgi:hypothetical protein
MAKPKRRKAPTKAVIPKTKKTFSLPNLQQDIIFLVAITILLAILLKPMLIDGLSPQGVDVVGSLGATHQSADFYKKTGDHALWNPYLFSGMPQYHRIGPVTFSIDTILNYLARYLSTVFIFYLFAAIGTYLLFRYLKMSPIISFIATIIFILMPHYKSLYTEGHMAKFRALMILPWVLLSFLYFLDRRSIFSAALFAIIFGAQIRTQHYQIVFYTTLLIFAVGLYPVLRDLLEKKYLNFAKSTALIFGAVILGITMSSQPLFLAKEYIPYSKRGKTTINIDKPVQTDSEATASEGVQIEYATQWSTHPLEMMTWFIPRFYGGMSSETYTGDKAPQLKGRMIPGYWGHMPFTQSYEYMGVIALMLAMIGIVAFRKKPFILSLLILSAFFVLLSFGRHFLFFYNIFYDYFPFFNKFRAPVMSVTVTSFVVSIFAAYGLHYLSSLPLLKSFKENKTLLYILGGFLSLGVLTLIFSQGFSYSFIRDNYDPRVLDIIKTARKELFSEDLIRYFILVILAGGSIYAFLFRKISFHILTIILTIIILFDIIDVQNRYQNKFADSKKIEGKYFAKSKTDNFLLADKEILRIFPVGQFFGDNRWAYYHQTIGGYSAIKMYTIEELIENNLYKGWDKTFPINLNLLKILNTKYLISPQVLTHEKFDLVLEDNQNKLFTYIYKDRLSRGFFVGEYKVITDQYERLREINKQEFDPSVTAILEEELAEIIQTPDSSWSVVKYFDPNKIEFEVFTDKKALFVISEMHYPPGWKIVVDNQPVDKIYKTDHALQSIIISEGLHQVQLRFEPDSYTFYVKISYASAGILYLIVILSLIMIAKEKVSGLLNKKLIVSSEEE